MPTRRTTPKQRAYWLAQFDQSNLNAAAFCRKHQISYQGFLNWRRKAGHAEAAPPSEFIELEVPAAAPPPTTCHSVVELTFPGGLLLRISPRHAAR